MSTRIYRSLQDPMRHDPSFDERWRGPDKGLIQCWEVGRQRSLADPELAERARRGELPILHWKGGARRQLKMTQKYGSLNYLAMWQGLRGEDLDINVSEETSLVCSRTGMRVIFTADATKYAKT
ncbi:MAG TPA: hypothetical protein ENN80_14460 [Candidatus Hydrogenedentes bacterium]|nr:hypothetical protein [Candidatus Hydrogenedentota bacterium]